jgi:hypothetical protein
VLVSLLGGPVRNLEGLPGDEVGVWETSCLGEREFVGDLGQKMRVDDDVLGERAVVLSSLPQLLCRAITTYESSVIGTHLRARCQTRCSPSLRVEPSPPYAIPHTS